LGHFAEESIFPKKGRIMRLKNCTMLGFEMCFLHHMKQDEMAGTGNMRARHEDCLNNSVASVRERTILTERPQLVDKVNVSICG
jgi:hypothetical protein